VEESYDSARETASHRSARGPRWTTDAPDPILLRTIFPERRVPKDPPVFVFVGIKNRVVALDAESGAEVWRTSLYSADFVTVLWDGEALLVANGGEVWRLDPATGSVIWHNEMTGLGRGLVSLTSSRHPNADTNTGLAAEKRRRDAAAQAAAAT
jgi:outer membrane protein assembly factor BamB